MKCNELKVRPYTMLPSGQCYDKNEVDEAIAELKEKLHDVDNQWNEQCKEIAMLKRALWLTRANRALEKIAWFRLWNASISTMNPEDGARQEFDKWKKNLGKFLKKAEEYR